MIKKIKSIIKKVLISLSKKKIDRLLKNNKYKNIFVFYPFFIWNEPLFQRHHQLSISLSKIPGNLCFFCTRFYQYDKCYGLRKIKNNLYVTSLYDYLIEHYNAKMIFNTYSTDGLSKLNEIMDLKKKGIKILYEYIDDLNPEFVEDYSKEYVKKHQALLKDEDIYVAVSADYLKDDLLKYRKKNYSLIPNGVQVEDFNKKVKRVPKELEELKKEYQKIILYYGALSSWFDYDLLKKCAETYKDYVFVLIGKCLNDDLKESKILDIKNIKYLGSVKYQNLYKYAKSSDLLTIPFVINDITNACSPVKLFEYMVCQKPILTTNMPEPRKYNSVFTAKDHNEYIKMITKCIKKNDDIKYLENELKEAYDNSWDHRAEQIMSLINK